MEECALTQEEKSDLAGDLVVYWMFEEAEAIKCVENLERMYKDYPQLYTIDDEEFLFQDDDFNDWFFHQRHARRDNMNTECMWACYKAHMNRRSGKCICDFCVPKK